MLGVEAVLPNQPSIIHRPKPIIRHVPLTNGILHANHRRSCCDRDYSDRLTSTSTSTSSPYDTEAEWCNGVRCSCNNCRSRCRSSASRRSHRFSLPRMSNYDDVGDSFVPAEPQSGSRVPTLKRRRRSRIAGCVLNTLFT